jgi:hypothetical protein
MEQPEQVGEMTVEAPLEVCPVPASLRNVHLLGNGAEHLLR